eukprot:4208304-Pleurochrysis_carterae.AAC.1
MEFAAPRAETQWKLRVTFRSVLPFRGEKSSTPQGGPLEMLLGAKCAKALSWGQLTGAKTESFTMERSDGTEVVLRLSIGAASTHGASGESRDVSRVVPASEEQRSALLLVQSANAQTLWSLRASVMRRISFLETSAPATASAFNAREHDATASASADAQIAAAGTSGAAGATCGATVAGSNASRAAFVAKDSAAAAAAAPAIPSVSLPNGDETADLATAEVQALLAELRKQQLRAVDVNEALLK